MNIHINCKRCNSKEIYDDETWTCKQCYDEVRELLESDTRKMMYREKYRKILQTIIFYIFLALYFLIIYGLSIRLYGEENKKLIIFLVLLSFVAIRLSKKFIFDVRK